MTSPSICFSDCRAFPKCLGHFGVPLVLQFAGNRSQSARNRFASVFAMVSMTGFKNISFYVNLWASQLWFLPQFLNISWNTSPTRVAFVQNIQFLQWFLDTRFKTISFYNEKLPMVRPGVNLVLNHQFLRWLMRAVSKTSVFTMNYERAANGMFWLPEKVV